jgi:predicted dehydrogenase
MLTSAVIGLGSMGRNHARVYHELPDVRLLAVSDVNDAVAKKAGEVFGVPSYTDHHVMLGDVLPDVVSIAVPTAHHEEVGLAALEAGAHVLIEKPIAATIEAGVNLIRKAHEVDRCLMIGHILRFNPAVQKLKEQLQNGELGRIFQVICRRVGPFPSRIRDVGVVIDLATHDLDVIRYLTGMDPIRVYAETEHRINTDLEDLVLGLLRFPGGIIAGIEINWLTPTKVREILVLGERGLFRVDDLAQDLFFYENAYQGDNFWPALQAIKGVSEGSMTRYALQRYEPLRAEIEAFIRAVQSGQSMPVSGEDGIAALRLALALVESGRTQQVIRV